MAYSPNTISQQDPAWKNERLGFSSHKIGPYGCTLTCLTMLVNGFGKNETPASLNQKLKGLGSRSGFIDDLVVWGGLPMLYPEFSMRKITLCRETTKPAPLDEIDAALARGQAVLVELDRSPAAGIQNHWVVLYKKEGNDYLMNDPWPYPVDSGETKLAPRYAAGRSLAKVITAVVWYEMADTAPPMDDGFYVQIAESASAGLRLRAQPTIDSVTLALIPARAFLRVVENETSARAKIGMTDEWLHIRDQNGLEGYVAAWFVDAVENEDDDENNETPSDNPINDPADEPNDNPNDDPIDEPVDEPNDAPISPPIIEKLKVYVSKIVGERGLRMRSRADLGGSLMTTLNQSTELTVLEDADEARAKIGVDGAWLHVEIGARQGYVAAWLVTLDPNEEIVEDPIEDEDPNDTSIPPVDEPVDNSDEEPQIPPTPGLKVYVVRDVGSRGLRMRAQPSLAGSLVSTLSQSTELTSLEDADVTHTKVGVNGEWLHVRSGTREGYVAAWLVVFDLDEEPSIDEPVNEDPINEPNDSPVVPVDETPIPIPETLTVTVFPSLGRNGLRMRSKPSLSGTLVGVLAGSTQLKVLDNPLFAAPKVGTYGQWLHVEAPNGRSGYVAAWYVKLDQKILNIAPPTTLIVYVTSLARGGLRMRKGPATGWGIVKTLKANSALTVLENEEEAITKIGATGQWLHVRDEAGAEGYVAAWYIVR